MADKIPNTPIDGGEEPAKPRAKSESKKRPRPKGKSRTANAHKPEEPAPTSTPPPSPPPPPPPLNPIPPYGSPGRGVTKCIYFADAGQLESLETMLLATHTSLSSVVQQLVAGFLDAANQQPSSRTIDVQKRVFL